MNKLSTRIALSLLLALALVGLTACGSTRSENGVTIQKKANYNLLDYIPGL
mgnify:CR=1 FL=1